MVGQDIDFVTFGMKATRGDHACMHWSYSHMCCPVIINVFAKYHVELHDPLAPKRRDRCDPGREGCQRVAFHELGNRQRGFPHVCIQHMALRPACITMLHRDAGNGKIHVELYDALVPKRRGLCDPRRESC